MAQNLESKPRAFGWLSFSIILHVAFIALVFFGSQLGLIPMREGTHATNEIEVSVEAPQGEQVETTQIAPQPVQAPEETQQVAQAPEVKESKPVVQAKAEAKVEPKKTVQPKPAKIATVLPPKTVKTVDVSPKRESSKDAAIETETIENSEVAVTPAIEAKEESEVKKADEKALAPQEAVNDELIVKQGLQDEEVKTETEAPAVAEIQKEEKKEEKPAVVAAATNAAPTANAQPTAAVTAEKPGQTAAQSDQNYGVPSATRTVFDLKQAPGNKPPQYPETARRQGNQGDLVLNYFVTRDGHVKDIKITRSSGHRILDDEAVRAISQYRFYPGQEGQTLHPVTFSLKGAAQSNNGRLRTSSKEPRSPQVN